MQIKRCLRVFPARTLCCPSPCESQDMELKCQQVWQSCNPRPAFMPARCQAEWRWPLTGHAALTARAAGGHPGCARILRSQMHPLMWPKETRKPSAEQRVLGKGVIQKPHRESGRENINETTAFPLGPDQMLCLDIHDGISPTFPSLLIIPCAHTCWEHGDHLSETQPATFG